MDENQLLSQITNKVLLLEIVNDLNRVLVYLDSTLDRHRKDPKENTAYHLNAQRARIKRARVHTALIKNKIVLTLRDKVGK